ncbi:hypothetical protein FOL47_003574, partial [Perkinsus chesapeaki]
LNADNKEIAVRRVKKLRMCYPALSTLQWCDPLHHPVAIRLSLDGDLYQQHLNMIIGWPPTKPRVGIKTIDYGKKMVAQLDADQKKLLDDEVNGYLAHHWWEYPPPLPNDQSELKTTRLRPVCDARSWNEVLPAATYMGSDTAVILTEIQLALNKLLLDGYSTREGLALTLSLNGVLYESRRLVFGLSVGPAGLEAFVSRLVDLMYCPTAQVAAAVDILRHLGGLHGFPFPREKTHMLNVNSTEPVRHLGVIWR